MQRCLFFNLCYIKLHYSKDSLPHSLATEGKLEQLLRFYRQSRVNIRYHK